MIPEIKEKVDTHYKKEALRAAKDFGYSKNVISKIKAAKSDTEISRIMATARVNGGK